MATKTIKGRDVQYVLPSDVKPGAIIAEGVVYETHTQTEPVPGKWLTTRAAVIFAADGEAVQVYARLDDAATAAFVAAVAADEKEARRA